MAVSDQEYKRYNLANLPHGITYNTETFRFNVGDDHSFYNYQKAYWYYLYIRKHSGYSPYLVDGVQPIAVFDFREKFYKVD